MGDSELLPGALVVSAAILSLLIIRRNRLRMASKAVRTVSVIVLSACVTTFVVMRQSDDPADPKILLSALVFLCSGLWVQHELFPNASLTLADPCGPGAKTAKSSKKGSRQPDSESGLFIRPRRPSTDAAKDVKPEDPNKDEALKLRSGHEQIKAEPKKEGAPKKLRGGRVKATAGCPSLCAIDVCQPSKCLGCPCDTTPGTCTCCSPQRRGTAAKCPLDCYCCQTGLNVGTAAKCPLSCCQTGLNVGKAVMATMDDCLLGCRQKLTCERRAVAVDETLKKGRFDLLSTNGSMQSPEEESNACPNVLPCNYAMAKDEPTGQEQKCFLSRMLNGLCGSVTCQDSKGQDGAEVDGKPKSTKKTGAPLTIKVSFGANIDEKLCGFIMCGALIIAGLLFYVRSF